MLWLFLGVIAFRPIYGTIWVLILTGALTAMPLGVQIVKSSLLQLGAELEEASRIVGGSWLQTYRRIVLRLLGPALLTIGLIVFVGASRNIGYVALLSTSANQPLAMLQLKPALGGRVSVTVTPETPHSSRTSCTSCSRSWRMIAINIFMLMRVIPPRGPKRLKASGASGPARNRQRPGAKAEP